MSLTERMDNLITQLDAGDEAFLNSLDSDFVKRQKQQSEKTFVLHVGFAEDPRIKEQRL